MATLRPPAPGQHKESRHMSIRVMTAVFDHSRSRLADRLVLLVIADRSDDDGSGCFRGRESIARMAGVSPSQVTVSVKRLKELGELEVTERPGRSNEYRVTVPSQNLSGSPSADLSDTLTHGCETPSHTGANDPSSNTSGHSSANASQKEPWQVKLESDGGPSAPPPDLRAGLVGGLKDVLTAEDAWADRKDLA